MRRVAKKRGVYGIYQISKDRAVYVGSSINLKRRTCEHRSRLRAGTNKSRVLQKLWDEAGEADFEIRILEETATGDLLEREQFWMEAMPTWPIANRENANRSMHGELTRHSPDSRQRISASVRAHPMTEETKQRLIDSRKGRAPWNKGGHLSEETKKKLSLAKLGQKRSPEARANTSKGHKGIKRGPFSEEHRRNIAEAQRRRRLNEKKLKESNQ